MKVDFSFDHIEKLEPEAVEFGQGIKVLGGERSVPLTLALSQAISLKRIADSLDKLTDLAQRSHDGR